MAEIRLKFFGKTAESEWIFLGGNATSKSLVAENQAVLEKSEMVAYFAKEVCDYSTNFTLKPGAHLSPVLPLHIFAVGRLVV